MVVMKRLIRHMKKIIIYISLFSALLYSNNRCSISIDEVFFNEDIIGYYLSAIDIQSGESNILLFDYSIDFSECNINEIDYALDVYFKIDMYVPTFESYSDAPHPLTEGTINLTNIPNGLQYLEFRNTDLSFNTQYLQGGTEFDLYQENYTVFISDSDIEDLTDIVMGQGRVPNGIYYFYFELIDPNSGIVYDAISKEINIFVPTYLELISPGLESISDTSSSVIFTTNPVFQWNTDYCSQCDYSIRVCQYKPDEHFSMYEAIQDVSILPMESGFYNINSSANVFQYPTTGTEPLIPGNLYVWQIKRSFETTNGSQDELSPVYIFKIQSINTSSLDAPVEDELFENLKSLIGDSEYNELFGSDGSLQNYTTIIPTMTVNQEEMSINYMLNLIELNNNGEINILEIEVE